MGGGQEYLQSHCWHLRFDENDQIFHVRCYLYSYTAEKVLGEEKALQENMLLVQGDISPEPEYPDIPFNHNHKAFLREFYHITDDPHDFDGYVDSFTPDATVILGTRKFQGREEIRQLLVCMWDAIEKRTHRPLQVFPFGRGLDVVMIHRTVEYVFKDGGQKTVDWAARCQLAELRGSRIRSYQVYLSDSAAW
ncbi:hypothetical protein BO70DRAFT_432604 [Aspergillus heteromorphus CBS 117.55]|uniref:SnoaL-like domain-containing protein n=1 Tax=Aspergillus heteromorphus CBS 117.55 TaxID=1448321 RepID=A0A317V6L4_9EURO|nr:uncharacterized protein BO70DRAFT_432604 [Aspergillus heteromorphus CBS 117.55]PWY69109.1 hypothetical protein BO70DRAFT_432604 [Aspergillus heteromorphus CBS 117.55]